MKINNLNTERLTLVPVTQRIVKGLLEGSYQEIEKMGLHLNEMWPTNDTKDILPIIHNAFDKNPEPSGFEFWMIVRKENMEIIGDIGFHGKPDEKGEVEIGFGFVELERGKGFGYEALSAIMAWLKTQESVKAIKADCLITNKASIRILEKSGMHEVFRNEMYIFWRNK